MPHMISAPGAFAAGVAIFLIVLWDAFEAIILPRRVTRKFRLARLFYRSTWKTWKFVICLIPKPKTREALLGFYGPLSLLVLVGVWAVGLVLGFALMQYGAGTAVVMTGAQPGFLTDIYLSGTTFFTLGLGDVIPRSGLSRVLVVTEAGFGFGFLAAVIGYLPFIYGSFSKREVNISLLDSRAGTPPTAGELLRRHSYANGLEALRLLLKEGEFWCEHGIRELAFQQLGAPERPLLEVKAVRFQSVGITVTAKQLAGRWRRAGAGIEEGDVHFALGERAVDERQV